MTPSTLPGASPRRRSAGIVIIALVVVAVFGSLWANAIVAASGSGSGTPTPSASPFFPVWSEGGASEEPVIGLLRERDGCVFLRSLGEDHLPLWPPGTRWARGTLIAPDGATVASTADIVSGSGTPLDARADAERLVGPIPDRCVPEGSDPFVRIFDVDRAPESLERAVVVPDVVGLGDTAAEAILRERVLDAVIETVPSSRADAGLVIRQRPGADEFAAMGSRVRVVVGIGTSRRIPIPDLPSVGLVVTQGRRLRLVDLAGNTITWLRRYALVENNLGPVYVQRGRAFYLLDPDARALTPATEREARTTYLDPPEPQLAEPPGVYRHTGHWRYVFRSPVSGDALGQWSSECETPYAVWIGADGEQQLVTGEPSIRDAPVSFAMGWSPDGEAIVFLPNLSCGSGADRSGVYLFSAPGDGRLVARGEGAKLWTTAEPAVS